MDIQVSYTSSQRKIRVVYTRGTSRRNMYFTFGCAEELIHYGLQRQRHDTPEGVFALPKELRRQDPVRVIQDLYRRRLLAQNIEHLGEAPSPRNGLQGWDIYWAKVYTTGLWTLTPLGEAVLQAIKDFLLAQPFCTGPMPVYALEPSQTTKEAWEGIQAACSRWGFLAESIGPKTNPHVMITPFKSTWWLRQFNRFEDRLSKLIPLG